MNKMDTVYIAGPMTGIVEHNFPAFFAMEEKIMQAVGCNVQNPARNFQGRVDLPRAEYFREDFRMLLDSTAVVFLPGWQRSAGARAEHAAAVQLGLSRYDYDLNPMTDEKSILEEADDLVSGDRNSAYGHPFEDFTRTGGLWGHLIKGLNRPVTPEEVAMCMVALKLSRECHKPKRDNRVDAAGYTKCLEAVVARREELKNSNFDDVEVLGEPVKVVLLTPEKPVKTPRKSIKKR